MRHKFWSVAILAAALLVGCGTQVVNPVTGQTERTVMDEPMEIAQGRQAHEELLKADGGAYPDAKLQAYVDGVGRRLAANSHRAHLPWTFTVLDSPEVNAFALPGGYVYVTRGILAYMESEADMAGVVGHEIGHVTARHGAQRATRQQHAGLGVLAATILGAVLEGTTGIGGSTELIGQAAQGVAAGYVARYSREQELQADQLGAEYLSRNRYDPANMVNVIGVLRSQEAFAADQARARGEKPAEGSSWLASHPSNEQRLREIREHAARYAAAGGFGDDGRERFLAAIDGMRFGESPEQGLTRGQHFYHPALDFAITAPAGWRIVNAEDSLTLMQPGREAALRLLPVPAQAVVGSHDQILRQLFANLQGRITRGRINGMEATRFQGVVADRNGRQQQAEFTLVSGPKNAHYLLVVLAADASARQRHAGNLAAAEQTFRPMTAEDRQAARPWQIRVVPMPRGGFAELQRQSVVSVEQLRLLNGVYGGGREPAAGQRVKTVVAGR